MTVTINGTTGITSPEVVLDNAAADGGQVVLKSSGYSDWNWDNYSGRLRAYYSATEYFTITNSGNVGIGTNNPGVKLQVAMPSDGSNGVIFRYTGGTNNPGFFLSVNESTTVCSINASGSTGGILALATNNVEAARISGGNLLVGTTSNSFGERLSIAASGNTANCGYFNFTTSDDRANTVIQHTRASGATSATMILFRNSSSTGVGSITSTGSATSYATSSDYRLKDNIQPMQNALTTVAQLKPVTYTWKADGSAGQGFIAHELQEVVPDCVTGKKDAVDEEGNPVYQGIDTSFLVATLTAAIQEQQALITALTARIEALEAKNA